MPDVAAAEIKTKTPHVQSTSTLTAPQDTKELANPTALLRPAQIDEMSEEKARLVRMLDPTWRQENPAAAAAIEDPAQMRDQLKRLDGQLERQVPRPYASDEIDAAKALEATLRSEIVGDGMLTQAEMRTNPPGAVDQHRGWEARNKAKILTWKHCRQRLHASGALDMLSDAADAANLELFRPKSRAGEMDMSTAQIVPKNYHFPPGPPPTGISVLSEDQLSQLGEMRPDLAAQIALMSNHDRAYIKAVLEAIEDIGDDAPSAQRASKSPSRKPKTDAKEG